MRADFLRALSWNFLSPAHVSSRDDVAPVWAHQRYETKDEDF
jgi:hypothetical protein